LIQNQKGRIYYGLHFYSGVAEYEEAGKAPYRVFLNENTLRQMDPSFAGRPVFVLHVDDVEQNIDVLRAEADGWVVESFYNEADGKHWVKFIAVSEKAERAIKQGMRLSNSYFPKQLGQGGVWNGVSYDKEITAGEYEHLALVPNPRYDESVVMTPEQFKDYNENHRLELKKLANNNDKRKETTMGFKLFERKKVENAIDIEKMSVVLPKSGVEVTLAKLINDADEAEGKDVMAKGEHHTMVGDKKMSVGSLVKKYNKVCSDLEELKSKHANDDDAKKNDDDDDDEEKKKKNDEAELETEVETKKKKVEVEGDKHNDDDDDDEEKKKKNKEDEEAKTKALELAEHEEKEIAEAKKKNAKEKADRLRNAQNNALKTAPRVELSEDRLARGKSRYGSN
jgi:hypothetical protein